MKNTKNGKIRKHKVPNIKNLCENSNKAKVIWPNFFSKIENSFKLLQEPVSVQITQQAQTQQKPPKSIFSERLTQLAKHKQRFVSLNDQSKRFQSLNSQQGNKRQERNSKPLSLPRMEGPSLSGRDAKLHLSSTIKSRKYYNVQANEIQQIAGSKIVSKGFDQIVSQIQQENQLKQKKQRQKHSVESESESQQEIALSKPSEMMGRVSLLALDDSLVEKSSRIAKFKGSKNPYDAYDKLLMEKIRIYRPKKPNFHHQLAWR